MRSRMATGALLGLIIGAVCAPAAEVFAQEATAPTFEVQIDGEYGYGLPPNISAHGGKIDLLINILHYFSIAVLGGWSLFLLYCLVRYRQRPGHSASYQSGWRYTHVFFVIGIAVFEMALDVGLSNPVLARVKDERPDESEALVVRVVAEQFAWNFHYPGPDGVFGRTSTDHLDAATNPLGIDPGDAAGEDDVVSGEMHVVVNRPVICHISSKDVIHSFAVPVMRVRQDAIPGMRIPVWFEPVKKGNYEIACAQLCGNNHYSMRALMVIEEEDAFATWLESQRPEEFDEDEFE